jgi:hypothetical protein
MAFNCQFRPTFLSSITIQQAIDGALKDIQTYLYKDAALPEKWVVRRISKGEAIAFRKGSLRGEWTPATKELLLVEGEWCVSTVVHETLHGVSSIQALNEALQLKPLFEGLTECLTGYVLYKKYSYTYSNCWNTDEHLTWCRIPDLYRPNTRSWGAFFHFVPIRCIFPIYFESHSNWKTMCSGFADAIRTAGYPKFRDVLERVLSSQITDRMFWAECKQIFGKKFAVISGTPFSLDFSSVK